MTLDPADERERVHGQYPAFPRREVVSWVVVLLVILLLDVFFRIGWWVYAIGVIALLSWELTKRRLRHNADRFADSRR